MSTDTTAQPPKSKRTWLIAAVILAVAIVLFLTFRPVTPAESVVADDGKPKVYEPVVYDTTTWQSLPKSATDAKGLMAELGAAATTEPALDYYGNHAERYRYSAGHEPPLYAILSDGLLEVVWYYPAPTDDDKTKAQAIDFAKRVYRMMGKLDGEQGTAVVAQMLQDKAVARQTLGKMQLTYAKCQDYQCKLILAK